MSDIEKYSLQTFEGIKRINKHGMEYWTGRELAKRLEYGRWGNFVNVVNKAKEACRNSSNMISIGKGARRPASTREKCKEDRDGATEVRCSGIKLKINSLLWF